MENELLAAEQNESHGQLPAQVQLAKTDKHALNTLLRNYMPFIKKCSASVFFKGQSREDNLTDAMLAFARSVLTYNPEHGAFIRYAAAVIHNRLVDNARKELSVQKNVFPLFAGTGADDAAWENVLSIQAYDRAEEERNLSLEIEEVNGEFSLWGFSWETLLKNCPRQERSRRAALRIAETVLASPELLAGTLKTRRLPVSRLAETFSKKAIDKYRQYIAAIIILSRGDYPYIYSFVPHFLLTK